MIRVNVHEAKTNLSKLLKKVEEGETVLICNRNLVVAELRAPHGDKTGRKLRPIGLHDGLVQIPDDAFTPMTDEEVAEWEDKPLG